MILTQEDQLGTHSTPAETARELDIDRQSLSRIIDQHLDFCPLRKRTVQKLTDLDIEKRMIRSRKLLSRNTQKTLQTAFFSDDKRYLR